MRALTACTLTSLLAVTALLRPQAREALPTAAPLPAVRAPAIDPDDCALLLIDAQQPFIDRMAAAEEPVLLRLEQFLVLAQETELPLIATFEVPTERNGELPARLERLFPPHGKRFAKHLFDATASEEIRKALQAASRRQIVVAGAETDVCVLQTVLGLRRLGFEVFVLADTVFSHEPWVAPAFDRMRDAGAWVTTYKSFFFELIRGVGAGDQPPEWRERYRRLGHLERSPYDLPPYRPLR